MLKLHLANRLSMIDHREIATFVKMGLSGALDRRIVNGVDERDSRAKIERRTSGRIKRPEVPAETQARSKRSRFITLVQAATKSFTNFSLASALA